MKRALLRVRHEGGNEQGGTLIEFSVALLLVFTVLFGVFETGRLLFTFATLAEAARAGVRYAIVHGADRTGSGVNGPSSPSDYSQVTLVVQNLASAAGLSLAAPTVTYGANPPVPGTSVTVTVSYTFTPVSALLSSLGVTLGSTTQGTICY
jgi:Flp pilus assembly protein TadG